jgi:adenine-specific DNA-methyltransferase
MLNGDTHRDCTEDMQSMPRARVDFILTDPYLVNYRDCSGRNIANDNDDSWLKPAFRHTVLAPDSLCVSV